MIFTSLRIFQFYIIYFLSLISCTLHPIDLIASFRFVFLQRHMSARLRKIP